MSCLNPLKYTENQGFKYVLKKRQNVNNYRQSAAVIFCIKDDLLYLARLTNRVILIHKFI